MATSTATNQTDVHRPYGGVTASAVMPPGNAVNQTRDAARNVMNLAGGGAQGGKPQGGGKASQVRQPAPLGFSGMTPPAGGFGSGAPGAGGKPQRYGQSTGKPSTQTPPAPNLQQPQVGDAVSQTRQGANAVMDLAKSQAGTAGSSAPSRPTQVFRGRQPSLPYTAGAGGIFEGGRARSQITDSSPDWMRRDMELLQRASADYRSNATGRGDDYLRYQADQAANRLREAGIGLNTGADGQVDWSNFDPRGFTDAGSLQRAMTRYADADQRGGYYGDMIASSGYQAQAQPQQATASPTPAGSTVQPSPAPVAPDRSRYGGDQIAGTMGEQPQMTTQVEPDGQLLRGSTEGIPIAEPGFGSFQRYEDAAMEQAMRHLQPQLNDMTARFEQDLVNKGIDPNSKAGRLALERMQRGQNDLRNSAAFNSMQFGLGAQNQAFQQGHAASQLAAAMDQARMANQLGWGGLENQRYLGELGNKLGYAGLDNQRVLAGMQQAMQQAQLAQQAQQFGQNLDFQYAGLNQADRQFGMNNQLAYTGMAGNLLGQLFGAQQGAFNTNWQNQLQGFNMRQALLGALPGWNPAMIDVNGSANAATASQQAAFDQSMQTAQAPWQTVGQLAGAAAMFSDRRLKDDVVKIGEKGPYNWYSWTWNDKAAELGLVGRGEGVIADEVPERYHVTLGEYTGVDYRQLMLDLSWKEAA